MLEVTATNADGVDTLGTDTGVGSLTTELESTLLAVVGAASTGSRSLVSRVTSDTHVESAMVDGRKCVEVGGDEQVEKDAVLVERWEEGESQFPSLFGGLLCTGNWRQL